MSEKFPRLRKAKPGEMTVGDAIRLAAAIEGKTVEEVAFPCSHLWQPVLEELGIRVGGEYISDPTGYDLCVKCGMKRRWEEDDE